MNRLSRLHIHHEGYRPLVWTGIIAGLTCIGIQTLFSLPTAIMIVIWLTALLAVTAFFRVPTQITPDCVATTIVAPASGTIVAIERLYETEYFNDVRLKISIFLSIFNVHLNTVPIAGQVIYTRYHAGQYLLAFHPKASELNERCTIVIQVDRENAVGIRQIAGLVARRISTYVQPGQAVQCAQELGFIRFGSRVDLLLPLDCTLHVHVGQKVRLGTTIIAELAQEGNTVSHQSSTDIE
jgi:phosphatidylserine decarboxylase